MADKTVASKNAKPNIFARIGNWFKKFFGKIGTSFKNMWHELKKVTWPSKEKLIHYSILVVIFMIFMMVVIGLLDLGSSKVVSLILTHFQG